MDATQDDRDAQAPPGAWPSSVDEGAAQTRGSGDEPRHDVRSPPWLSAMHMAAMLLVAFGLPGAPFAVLILYVEGTLTWPEVVQAGCWLIALVALLGTALWIAASLLEHARGSRAPRSARRS